LSRLVISRHVIVPLKSTSCFTKGDAGKPCAFPFVYRDCTLRDKIYPDHSSLCSSLDPSTGPEIPQEYHKCTSVSMDYDWCYTRTYPNGSGMVGYWGKCKPECAGEMPTPDNPHNLASEAYNDLWSTNVFDLQTWGSGLCHTYNPPVQSPVGTPGLLYALIGNASAAENVAFHGVNIYLHHRNTFWPGYFAAEQIHLLINENIDATFEVTVTQYLNRPPLSPCTEDVNYSLTGCLTAYVEKMAGCRLDWFLDGKDLLKGNYCEGQEAIEKYIEVLQSIDFTQRTKTLATTGQEILFSVFCSILFLKIFKGLLLV
jgi:hypothetical protein